MINYKLYNHVPINKNININNMLEKIKKLKIWIICFL